jgi:hypothetical protein
MSTRFSWSGRRWLEASRAAAAHGLELGMEHVLAKSRELVPLEEGTLERSGRSQVDAEALEGVVSYDTVYARRQHEELTWKHSPGRQAKYLEQPFRTEAPTVLGLVAAEIRRSGAEGTVG